MTWRGLFVEHDAEEERRFPTTDERELIFTRYTQPEPDQQLLLEQLGWRLPAQPPPKITAKREVQM